VPSAERLYRAGHNWQIVAFMDNDDRIDERHLVQICRAAETLAGKRSQP